ncbi:DNA-deoxyinosine glycosylase [Rhodococcus sp. Eu-32]|nr:DNA-deoxyinosine glycosylase [Rhodococcus sp. Eu-32]
MVVEYSWIQHGLHCPPFTGELASFRDVSPTFVVCHCGAVTTVHSFPPIIDRSAHTLILGSMPGVASLTANQYYAHPRNAFWPIMGDLFEAGPSVPYEERTTVLQSHGIAVWDVLKLCTRLGSLDSAIEESSIVVNDIDTLIREHPTIERIFFNGAKAEASFLRYVTTPQSPIALVRLPSTSPAHASMTYERKLDAWRAVVDRG